MPPAFTIHIHRNINAQDIGQQEARCAARVGQENIKNGIIKRCEHPPWKTRRAQSPGSLWAHWTKQFYFGTMLQWKKRFDQ